MPERTAGLHEHEIAHVCAAYGLAMRGFTRLGGSVNANYAVDTGDGSRYVLTVLLDRKPADIARCVGVMRWLATCDYLPSAPLDGDGKGPRGHAVMVRPFMPGVCHDVLPERLLAPAGRLLARLHGLGLPPEGTRLAVRGRRMPVDAMAAIAAWPDRDFTARLSDALQDPPLSDTGLCVVHGDLFADNLVEGPDGSLTAIDWETAAIDDPLLDLAIAVVGLGLVDGRPRPERVRLLLDGYRRVRPLDHDAEDRVRALTRYAAGRLAYFRYLRRHDPRTTPYAVLLPAVDDLVARWPARAMPVR